MSLPPNVRDAFATGAWDTTGLLLDRYDEVNAARQRLPYVERILTASAGLTRPLVHRGLPFFFSSSEPRNAAEACDRSPPLRKIEPHLTTQPDLRHRQRDELAARDLRFGAAPRQQRDAHLHRDRALDALEARQRHEDVGRDVMLLEQPQHAIADVRRIVVRDDGLARALRQRHLLAVRQRVRRVDEHHQLVLAEHHRAEPRLGGLKRQHAEVERCPARPRRRPAAPECAARRRGPAGAPAGSAR